jgi:Protein of unknown function (DUF3300)
MPGNRYLEKGGDMKVAKLFIRAMAWVIIFVLAFPPAVMAQDSGETAQQPDFSREELAQMLAPIALYPDSVVAAILMASTYPVEVVEAERWLKENENLTGDELDQALQETTWDSSVKTLCHFPTLLYAMSDDLERTTRLGDAFLAQQDDVMNMIQELRRKAEEDGNLRTTSEQKVVVDQGVIQIEPVDPSVIYVPVYNPLYVYGPWWYPDYPPYYWYYPTGGFITSGVIGFGFGIFVGASVSSWCWPDWHHHRIDVDLHKTERFNRFDRGRWNFNSHVWVHNPVHRRGAAYRFSETGRRFGEQIPRMSRTRPESRGYEAPRQGTQPFRGTIQRPEAPRQGTQPFRGTIQRPEAPRQGTQPFRGTIQRPEAPRQGTQPFRGTIQRPEAPRQGTQPFRGTIQRPAVPQTRSYRETTPVESFHPNVFQGVGQGSFERRSSERGFQSRQSGRSSAPAGGGIPRGNPGGATHGGPGGGFRR